MSWCDPIATRVRRGLSTVHCWICKSSGLERESNPRQTTYQVVALPTELSSGGHPGIEPGALRRNPLMAASTDSGARHVPHQRTNPDAAHRRGGRESEPLTCERWLSSADSCAHERQLRRDPLGSRAASHWCTSARMCRPSSRKSSKRLGTYGRYTSGMPASSGCDRPCDRCTQRTT